MLLDVTLKHNSFVTKCKHFLFVLNNTYFFQSTRKRLHVKQCSYGIILCNSIHMPSHLIYLCQVISELEQLTINGLALSHDLLSWSIHLFRTHNIAYKGPWYSCHTQLPLATKQFWIANCQVSWLGRLVLFLMLVVSWRELVGPERDMPLFPWVNLFAQGRNDAKRALRRFSTLLLQQKITNMKTARNMLTMSVMYQ